MSTCSSDRLLSACNTSILNIRMASNGFRPALLFLSSPGVSTTALMSARKLSHGTRRSMASSGSPIAEQGFQALIGIEKSQLPHRRLCESKSQASDSHRSGEAAIFRGAHYSLSRATPAGPDRVHAVPYWLSRTQCYVSALDKAASAARSPVLKLSSVHR